MKYRLMVVAVFSSCLLAAQDEVPPQQRLKVTGSVSTEERFGGLFTPAKCDSDGNVYVRTRKRGERAPDALRTLKRFAPDGRLTASYSLAAQRETEGLNAFDFAIAP